MLYKAIKKAHSQGGLKIASAALVYFVVYQKSNLYMQSPRGRDSAPSPLPFRRSIADGERLQKETIR